MIKSPIFDSQKHNIPQKKPYENCHYISNKIIGFWNEKIEKNG